VHTFHTHLQRSLHHCMKTSQTKASSHWPIGSRRRFLMNDKINCQHDIILLILRIVTMSPSLVVFMSGCKLGSLISNKYTTLWNFFALWCKMWTSLSCNDLYRPPILGYGLSLITNLASSMRFGHELDNEAKQWIYTHSNSTYQINDVFWLVLWNCGF